MPFAILFLAVALAAAGEFSGEKSAPALPAKTNLLEFLARSKRDLPPVGTTLELDPHWVGTVKRVYLRGGEAVYRADTPEDIRFTHLLVQDSGQNGKRLVIARLRWVAGSFLSSTDKHAVAFREELPAAETLSRVTKVDELVRLFGPQHGWTDGWGLGGTNHWTEGWTWFARAGRDQLRYLNVFAHVSAPSATQGKLSRLDSTNATIDILVIREGLFRPADPRSVEERQRFLTAEELFVRQQSERARERAKYPQPLRALVESHEKPDDWDMAAYIAAINQVRAKPDPELFRQLVCWMNEDSVEFGSYLEDILFFDDPPPELHRWQRSARQSALRALIQALPEVRKPDVLEETLMTVLVAQGGGKLKFLVPGTKATIDLATKKEAEGLAKIYACDGLSETNIAQVAAHCQVVLKKKYADLWPQATRSPGGKIPQ